MKRQLLTLVGLLACLMLSAATVTKDEARQKALLFLQERGGDVNAARGMQQVELQLKEGVVTDKLYVFNVGQKDGFVIVSGDDCTGDVVLGYANRGEITSDNMPDNLRAWLQGYADQIRWMQEHGIKNDAAGSRGAMKKVKTTISPLLTTKWNQGEPFNTYCPYLNAAGTSQSVTGCVATATAQLMYYQATKNSITATAMLKDIPSYASTSYYWYFGGTKYTEMPQKKARTFDWTKMNAEVNTADAREEVARLMEYVGAGVEMQYGPSNSGGSSAPTSSVAYMLSEYFGYDKDVRYVERNSYSYAEWLDLIYQELVTNGPVIYDGQSTSSGHAFIVEGYDEEDYFYINWGWGGMSDGVFKLSVLYPDAQGIGGSSAQNGYSIGQGAIVNVVPYDDGTNHDIRMTLTNISVDKKTYNRASGTANFTDVALHWDMWNWTGATHAFDLGWALYDGENQTIIMELGNNTFEPTYGIPLSTTYQVSFGANLADGEYKLVPVSRETGTEEWLPNYRSERYYVKAIINGNTLTLEPMGDVNLSATLAVSGNTVGNPVTVTATVTNNGSFYSGDLVLVGNGYDVAAKQVEIESGAKSNIVFTFTPTAAANNYVLKLEDKNSTEIATTSIKIVAGGGSSTGNLTTDLNTDLSFDNSAGTYYYNGFYGATLNGHLKLKNTSVLHDHTSGLLVTIWQNTSGNSYISLTTKSYPTNISKKGGTQTVDFSFSGLTIGTSYLLSFSYADETEIASTYAFDSKYGITTYAADGSSTTIAPQSAITVGEDILALDISQINEVTSVTPNSNPNTLYIVGNSVPSGLTGKNVVVNGVASNLTLNDNSAFYSPVSFTAIKATYTRTFTQGADGSKGWNTIVLPFDVTTVKQGSTVIDWFHNSSDEGKQFWLKAFSGESGNTVSFDYVDKMKANIPYIIAVPGSKWGAAYDLTGKTISFEGTGISISPTSAASASGNNYKFVGSTVSTTITDNYALSAAGDKFERTSTTVAPFRAYFKQLNMLAAAPQWLTIGSADETTSIEAMLDNKAEADKKLYNLNGQRVLKPEKGLFIVNGKKVVVK